MANKLKDKFFPSEENMKRERDTLVRHCGFDTEDLSDALINSPFKSETALESPGKVPDVRKDDVILPLAEGVKLAKEFKEFANQKAKTDAGKLQITLVPRQIIRDIARVRMYGNKKYHNPDNWKEVEVERYRDALCRHLLAYLDDPKSIDEESGIPHYMHMACNMAFICEMEMWANGKEM